MQMRIGGGILKKRSLMLVSALAIAACAEFGDNGEETRQLASLSQGQQIPVPDIRATADSLVQATTDELSVQVLIAKDVVSRVLCGLVRLHDNLFRLLIKRFLFTLSSRCTWRAFYGIL